MNNSNMRKADMFYTNKSYYLKIIFLSVLFTLNPYNASEKKRKRFLPCCQMVNKYRNEQLINKQNILILTKYGNEQLVNKQNILILTDTRLQEEECLFIYLTLNTNNTILYL